MTKRIGIAGWAVIFLALISLAGVGAARAGEARADERIIIDEDVTDDLYLAADEIIIRANVEGDVVAAAGSLVLQGDITGDLLYAGQTLTIEGSVSDDVRAAGGAVVLEPEANIGDDLNAAAAALEMRPGSAIGGDVYFGAGQALIDEVAGSVYGGGQAVQFAGPVGADAAIGVSEGGFVAISQLLEQQQGLPPLANVPTGLSFGEGGQIAGDLSYSAQRRFEVPGAAVAGEVTFEQQEATETEDRSQQPWRPLARAAGFFVSGFLLSLGLGLVLQRAAPDLLDGAVTTLRTRLPASFGVGLLAAIFYFGLLAALLVAFLILVFTGAAFILGPLTRLVLLTANITVTAYRVITFWVAPLLAGVMLGRALLRGEAAHEAARLALGLGVVWLVLSIPWVGRVALGSLVGLAGLGALLLLIFSRAAAARPQTVTTAPTAPPPPPVELS